MVELEKQILEKYADWQKFVSDQSPEQLVVNYDFVNNFYDVYETSPISLKLLTDIYPRNGSYAGYEYLGLWLRYLNDFLNINKGLQPQYIKQLSYILYAKYNHFRISDLKLLFDYILESRYGTFYGSIDTQRVSSSFYEYNRERNDVFIKIIEKEKEAEKNEAFKKSATKPDFSRLPNLAKLLGKDKELNIVETIAAKKSI